MAAQRLQQRSWHAARTMLVRWPMLGGSTRSLLAFCGGRGAAARLAGCHVQGRAAQHCMAMLQQASMRTAASTPPHQPHPPATAT